MGWTNDFEARYPEDNMDITNLQALSTWLVSTNTEAATDEPLEQAVTYDGIQYDIDSKEYRLAKFRAELPDRADVDAMIFYYLITEIFLCIDQREKNAFPTLFAEMGKWMMLFYDADSTLGIDNKGKLAFEPYLEDIDYTAGGDPVFNGQGSVLFVNLRKAFYPEIMAMYQQFRVDGLISYDVVNGKFEEHQNKWCEAIFNEDMYRKCLYPMISENDSQYLPMLLGKKEMQRKWWLYNRFRFLDSKYITGNSMETRIMLRTKSKANVWLTPYVNMYGHVYYNDEMVEHRMERGKSYEYVWSASGAEDAVIGINDADMLTSIGDLADLQVETIDIALATHLTSLKIGDASSSYENKNLTSVTFGNNTLLQSIDLRNCSALNTSLDIVGCINVEEVYCEGTSITGINLPSGGILKTLHLPDTVANLTIRNQPFLADFVLSDSSKLTTLRLENVGALIDTPSIINAMADGSRIRALDIDWEIDSEVELRTLLNKLIKMRGLDENGNNLDSAVLTGRIRVNEKVSDEIVGEFYNYFVDVVIDDGSDEIYIINYKDRDGTILYSMRVSEGASAIDPIAAGYLETPEPIVTETYRYEFAGWSTLPTSISRHYIIVAQYHTKFAIKFYNGNALIYQQWSVQGDSAVDPVITGAIDTPVKTGTSNISYQFSGWDNLPTNVQASVSVHAQYDTYWAAKFYNDNTLYLTEWVIDGGTVVDPKNHFEDYVEPTRTSIAQYDYRFLEWDGDFDTVMTASREFHAVYTSVLRKYNVYFYNGDNMLMYTAENIPYGSSTSYIGSTPVKQDVEDPEDYVFKGWSPLPNNITGETKCYAVYKYTGYLFGKLGKTEDEDYGYGTIDNPDWEAINKYWDVIAADSTNVRAGLMSQTEFKMQYPIGARMLVRIGEDKSGNDIIADMEVIGHFHDNMATDGVTKAPLTFFCLDLPHLQHYMNEAGTNEGGWFKSDMRAFTNGELFNAMPQELRNAIKPVFKISDGGSNDQALMVTEDSCWLASYDEVGFTTTNGNLVGQGEAYSDIFTSNKDSRKKYVMDSSEKGGWWLRSSNYSSTNSLLFLQVTSTGGSYAYFSYVDLYVAFGFCI